MIVGGAGEAGVDVGAACAGPKAARPMVDYRVDWTGVALEDGVGRSDKLGCGILEGRMFLQSSQIRARPTRDLNGDDRLEVAGFYVTSLVGNKVTR